MEINTPVMSPHTDFKRFLYTGQISTKYIAGSHELVKPEDLTFFASITKDLVNACQTIKIFEEAKKNSSFTSHIVFALAATIKALSKEEKDYESRELFYQIVPIILSNSESLMLFVKYTNELGLKMGTRWQNCIKNWYKKCDFNILSSDIALITKRYGWTHRDIIRLAHIPPCSTEESLIFKYLWSGTDGLSEIKNIPEYVIEDIKNSDSLKKCHNFTEASTFLLKMKNVNISRIPNHLLHSHKDNSEVWKVLLEKITPIDILNSIECLQLAGMLEDQSEVDTKPLLRLQLTSHLISIISKITAPPVLAYIAYCDYKNNHKFLKIKEKQGKKKKLKNKDLEGVNKKNDCSKSYVSKNKKLKLKYSRRCVPSNDLTISLKNLVDRSLQNVEKLVNITCMITIDMQNHMFYSLRVPKSAECVDEILKSDTDDEKDDKAEISQLKVEDKQSDKTRKSAKCYHSKNVVPGQAGVLLALYVSKLIKNTTVGVFTNDGVKIVKVFKNTNNSKEIMSMDEAEVALKIANCGKSGFQKPFKWAIEKKLHVDLFINVVTSAASMTSSFDKKSANNNLYSMLKEYRTTMNAPETRVITLSLSTHKSVTTRNSEEGIFDISGFDATVPEIIKNFALREFD